MHVALALAADCWGALDFIGGDGTIIERKLKISRSFMSAPPAGGAQKLCVIFEGDERKCFLAKGEIKKLANLLRRYETDLWVGAVVLMSAGEKKFKGQPVMGMVVKKAAFPGSKGNGPDDVQS